jgi:hypothetical protein
VENDPDWERRIFAVFNAMEEQHQLRRNIIMERVETARLRRQQQRDMAFEQLDVDPRRESKDLLNRSIKQPS